MALRYFRRVRVLPGLRLNISKRGVSVSVGHRGCWWTSGPTGRRATFGIPGSGLSYSTRLGSSQRDTSRQSPKPAPSAIRSLLVLALVVIVLLVVAQMALRGGR